MKKNLIRFDLAMKRLLRNRTNFAILEGFLSELMGTDIIIENLLESESNKQTAKNKRNQVDILAKDTKGELIIIEVQGNEEYDYVLRMLFGASKLLVDNSDEGMKYRNVKKIISLNIVYFDIGKGKDYIYHGQTSFKGIHEQEVLGLTQNEQDACKATEIERAYPEYYVIKVKNFNDVSKNTLDEWIDFLKNERIKEDTKAKGLKEAMVSLDKMKLSKEELMEYERDSKSWYDDLNGWNNRFDDGKHVGEANKEKYAEEKVKQDKLDIAKNCLKNGLSIEMTATLTGLTEAEIKTLNP